MRLRSSAFSFSRVRIIPSSRLSSCWIVLLSGSSVMNFCLPDEYIDVEIGDLFCILTKFQHISCPFDP